MKITTEKKVEKNDKPFAQRAVWRNGGSSPQTILCKIARYYPAGSSVEAATAPSRWDVVCNFADSAVIPEPEQKTDLETFFERPVYRLKKRNNNLIIYPVFAQKENSEKKSNPKKKPIDSVWNNGKRF